MCRGIFFSFYVKVYNAAKFPLDKDLWDPVLLNEGLMVYFVSGMGSLMWKCLTTTSHILQILYDGRKAVFIVYLTEVRHSLKKFKRQA